MKRRVGRVTPCAPPYACPAKTGAHGVTRPTSPLLLRPIKTGIETDNGLSYSEVGSQMKVQTIKELIERQPFRPFAVRLSNGAQYTFNKSRNIGAPEDYHMIFYFGQTEAVRIDTDSIVEVIGQK